MTGRPQAEMIHKYAGKNVEEMTREELIEAIKYLGNLYQQTCERNSRAWALMTDLQKAERSFWK